MGDLRRVVLGVRYVGKGFEGWQTQPHGNTVQDTLTKALENIAGHTVQLYCAGRTDTGVHAREQVVHFDTPSIRPIQAWVKGVNAFLPSSVSVVGAKELDESFHARFAATARTYRYYFYVASSRNPFLPFMTWVHYPLDLAAMRLACETLIGTHDFTSFRAAQCQANSPIRTIFSIDLVEGVDSAYFEIRGNAFLHHMVRNMVGTLMEVGLGNKPIEWVCEVLAAKSREVAARTWPADGLSLWHIEYPSTFAIKDVFLDSIVGDNSGV